MRWLVVVVTTLVALSGCSVEAESTPVVDAEELALMATEASDFADRMYGSWPDLDAFFADLADNAAFYDANAGDYFVGRDVIVEFWATLGGEGMPFYFPDYRPTPSAVFLAAEDLAFPVDWFHLSPEEPWPDGVELFLFDGDQVAEYALWYSDQTIDSLEARVDWPVVETWVADYVQAWTSEEGPGLLYAEGAAYEDTLFGMEAAGSDDIALLAGRRFGDIDASDIEVGDLYALSIGDTLVDASSGVSGDDVVGIGFIYRWPMRVNGQNVRVESLVLCEFGTMGEDWYFDGDPERRIVREFVFHNAEVLAAVTR